MDGQTDGRTDGRTDSPCVLQDFVPFGAAALLPLYLNHTQLKQGMGTADHLLPLGCYFIIRAHKGNSEHLYVRQEEPNQFDHGMKRNECNLEETHLNGIMTWHSTSLKHRQCFPVPRPCSILCV